MNGTDWPAVGLKKPPTLMCPVESVVAARNALARSPAASAVRTVRSAVTAPIAAPSSTGRCGCCMSARKAIEISRAKRILLRRSIQALPRRDAHDEPRWIQIAQHGHGKDDDYRCY